MQRVASRVVRGAAAAVALMLLLMLVGNTISYFVQNDVTLNAASGGVAHVFTFPPLSHGSAAFLFPAIGLFGLVFALAPLPLAWRPTWALTRAAAAGGFAVLLGLLLGPFAPDGTGAGEYWPYMAGLGLCVAVVDLSFTLGPGSQD